MNTPGKLCRILVFSLCSFLLFVTLRHSNCFDFFGLSAMSLLLSKSSWLCLSFSSWYQFWKLSKQFSHSFMSDSLWPHGLQHAWFPCSSPTPWAYSNSCPSSWWCHPTISSSVVPFSSRLQSFPAFGSFPMSQFFTSGGQSTGVSASTSVLPMNIQNWFPLGLTGLISLLEIKELSGIFSNTIVQKHQFFFFFNHIEFIFFNINLFILIGS